MSFILFIAIVGLFICLQSISNRLARLESRLRNDATPAVQVVSQAAPIRVADAVSAAMQGQSEPVVVSAQANAAANAPLTPPAPPEGLHRPVSDISAAQWVGGVGALALLLGIGFFFKYAIDQGWITEWMRIILGLAVGGLLVLLGDLWKQKYAKYSHVLTGSGLALLYFTVFAAYQYYHILGQPIAFLCTIVITVFGIGLSYRYNSKALGLFAVVGGYISPLLVGSGENKQVGLFVYLTIVNVGVLLMLLKQYWVELLFIALFGTAIGFMAWFASFSAPENVGTSIAFLLFNYLLVGIITATIFRKLHESKQLTPDTDLHLGVFYSLFGVSIFTIVSGLLYANFREYLGPIMLLLGVITFLSYAIMDRLEYVRINYPLSLVGSKFLVAAVLWQFAGTTESIYLIALSALGIGIGFLVKRKDLRVWGLILLLIATLKVVVSDYDTTDYTFLFNARFGMELLVSIVLLAAAYAYEKYPVAADEVQVPSIARVAVATIVWLAGSQEVMAQFAGSDNSNTRNLLLSVWWMLYAGILTIVGGLKGLHILRKAAVVLFGITVIKVFLYDVQALELGYRVVSFILLGVILLSVAFFYQKNKDKLQRFLGEEDKIISNI